MNGGSIAAELKREAVATRRLFERVPEDRLSWRPHPRSMSLGMLGMHLALLPRGIAEFITPTSASVPDVVVPEAESVRGMVAALDEGIAFAEERLEEWGEGGLDVEVRMVRGDVTLMSFTRREWIRTLMLNHAYHHRGQLTVYLRLLDVPLPPVYGPTADEAF